MEDLQLQAKNKKQNKLIENITAKTFY